MDEGFESHLSAYAPLAIIHHVQKGQGTVVVTGSHLEATLAIQSEHLIQTRQGYRQLELRKSDIKTTYRLTFLLVTLMILLATSWVGLLLARRITVPIEAVAEGTRRLSEGDLDYQVEVPADDELGVLVRSFNRMTTELRRNKEDLISANRNLAEERAVIAAVLQNVAAGVISVDEEGRILTCNRVALTMLRQDNEPAVGRPVAELWQDPERHKLAELFEQDPGPIGRISRSTRNAARATGTVSACCSTRRSGRSDRDSDRKTR